MVQNHLSIDFRHTVRGTNSYEFGYNVEHSIEVATSIVLQHYDGKKSLPAWYVKNDKRLYADTINGYWNVDGFILTFVAGSDPAADIEARVSALESASVQQAGEIVELEGNITGIESSIREINSTLSVQSTDISSLKTRATAVENKANTNETNISSLSSRMTTAEGNIDSLASRTAIAESDISSNATDISSLKIRTTVVENKANTNETNISSLSSRIATAEGNIAINTSDITSLKTRVTTVETENALLRELINGIDADIYRTASGNPVTFSDAKAANVKELTLTIPPTQSGSGTPSPENIRSFVGYDSVLVTRAGVSLIGGVQLARAMLALKPNSPNPDRLSWDTVNRDITVHGQFSAGISHSQKIAFTSDISFKPGTRYSFAISGRGTSNSIATNLSFVYSDGSYDSIYFSAPRTEESMIAVSAEGKTVTRITFENLASNVVLHMEQCAIFEGDISGETPIFPLDTEISTGNAGTVYGGTLNITTGELTVTYGRIASYDGETVPGGWISSTGALSTGAEVVYPLATPLTYSLTPTQVATLAGYNAISADAGPVRVTYKADPAITLE